MFNMVLHGVTWFLKPPLPPPPVCRALLPRTFLQMVGQKVLFHATQQLPVLSSLPEDLPEAVLQALFTQPFAEAVEMVGLAGWPDTTPCWIA